MSETAPETPAPEAAPETPAPEPEAFDEARAKEKIRKANSEAENLRKRLKELEPIAQRAKELEESQKTEAEKVAERLAAAEKRATDAELRVLRRDVADAKGLTAAQAKYLTGATQEELEAAADQILVDFPASSVTPPGKPRERLRGGGDPEVEPIETDPNKLAELVPRNKF